MSNLEKYNSVFMDSFNLNENDLNSLKYQSVKEWDSVGHMSLITNLEDVFEIEMEIDDIIDFSSYEKGKELLGKYNVEI
jgi:acyl carrier protein